MRKRTTKKLLGRARSALSKKGARKGPFKERYEEMKLPINFLKPSVNKLTTSTSRNTFTESMRKRTTKKLLGRARSALSKKGARNRS
jgi:hypothetical protein